MDTGVLLMGFFTFLNFGVIKFKIEKERYGDAILDSIVLVIIGIFFSGSTESLQIGVMASAIMSLYLYVYPPKLTNKQKEILTVDRFVNKITNEQTKKTKIKIS